MRSGVAGAPSDVHPLTLGEDADLDQVSQGDLPESVGRGLRLVDRVGDRDECLMGFAVVDALVLGRLLRGDDGLGCVEGRRDHVTDSHKAHLCRIELHGLQRDLGEIGLVRVVGTGQLYERRLELDEGFPYVDVYLRNAVDQGPDHVPLVDGGAHPAGGDPAPNRERFCGGPHDPGRQLHRTLHPGKVCHQEAATATVVPTTATAAAGINQLGSPLSGFCIVTFPWAS